jgi:8-oxo-dGTP pyrophosphatase MutT (NUDIX family)
MLPGGRIDDGEGIIQCLRREIKEELGVKIDRLNKSPRGSLIFDSIRDENTKFIALVFEMTVCVQDIETEDDILEYEMVHIDKILERNLTSGFNSFCSKVCSASAQTRNHSQEDQWVR